MSVYQLPSSHASVPGGSRKVSAREGIDSAMSAPMHKATNGAIRRSAKPTRKQAAPLRSSGTTLTIFQALFVDVLVFRMQPALATKFETKDVAVAVDKPCAALEQERVRLDTDSYVSVFGEPGRERLAR